MLSAAANCRNEVEHMRLTAVVMVWAALATFTVLVFMAELRCARERRRCLNTLSHETRDRIAD